MDWGLALATIGTVALAIISGAGGAAILELYWKPRKDRRKAATLLLAEVLINTERLIAQTFARQKNVRNVPQDFHMGTRAWDVAAGGIGEIPARLLKGLVVLYARYDELNKLVPMFAEALADIERHQASTPERKKAERHADLIIDVFNTGIDAAIDSAKILTPDIFKHARIKPKKDLDTTQLKQKVDKIFEEREERIRQMNAGDRT